MCNPIAYFASLEDPRIDRCKAHALTDIIFLTLAAVLSGCESWDDIEEFGHTKEEWLRNFIPLENGIPSHDTINRVFAVLDAQAFQHCFMEWVREVADTSGGQIIAIDGKRMCNAGVDGRKAVVHMVHAWSEANHLLLGQYKTDDKSNEITAIPTLLDLLVLQGYIVTIDAMGCQRDIAKAIINKEADYVLAVKDNQGHLFDDIGAAFERAQGVRLQTFEQVESGHGRIEYRCCRVLDARDYVCDPDKWVGLRTIAQVESRCTDKASGKVSTEQRYFISSLAPEASLIAKAVRAHWSVENNLHWSLDVVFGEDYSTKAAGNAAQNFGLVTRMALSMLKAEKSVKRSLKGKRLKAAWDNNYLQKLLTG